KPRWAKGLVNGVLRNFLRQKESLSAQLKVNEVARYSYPQWWINKLKQQYPHDWQAILETGNRHPPMTLRINSKQSSVSAYAKLLARQGIEATTLGGEAIMLSKPISVDQVPGFLDGVVSVQDYGAQFAAHMLDVKPKM